MGSILARYRSRTVFGERQSSGLGRRILQVALGLIVLAIIVVVAYLGLGDYQPEPQRIERTIDVDTGRS